MKRVWDCVSLDELVEAGRVQLGRGKIISKVDLAATPGPFPVYSSAKDNDGCFGHYGHFMFDEEMITWSIDGGGRLFHRQKHKFSVTNVGGTLRIVDNATIHCRYLYYALSHIHSEINFDWVAKAHPSVIRRLYNDIPLPLLAEQQRIVAILDQALGEIAALDLAYRANLARAETFGKVALHTILDRGGEGWAYVSLHEVAAVESGVGFPEAFQGKVDEALAFFKVGDMNTPGNEIAIQFPRHTVSEVTRAQLGARIFPIGSIIFPKVGGAIATDKKRLVGRPCCVDNNVMGVVPDPSKLESALLHQLMLNKPLTDFSNDAGLPSIRKTTVQAWRFKMPTDLAEQRLLAGRLAEIGSDVRELRAIYERKLALFAELKQSLLARAFSGELTREPIAA